MTAGPLGRRRGAHRARRGGHPAAAPARQRHRADPGRRHRGVAPRPGAIRPTAAATGRPRVIRLRRPAARSLAPAPAPGAARHAGASSPGAGLADAPRARLPESVLPGVRRRDRLVPGAPPGAVLVEPAAPAGLAADPRGAARRVPVVRRVRGARDRGPPRPRTRRPGTGRTTWPRSATTATRGSRTGRPGGCRRREPASIIGAQGQEAQ